MIDANWGSKNVFTKKIIVNLRGCLSVFIYKNIIYNYNNIFMFNVFIIQVL